MVNLVSLKYFFRKGIGICWVTVVCVKSDIRISFSKVVFLPDSDLFLEQIGIYSSAREMVSTE